MAVVAGGCQGPLLYLACLIGTRACRRAHLQTVRFSGRTYPKLARIVRALCAGRCRLPLLVLSTRHGPSGKKPTRTVQGMARVRFGQAPAWPLASGRSVRRGSRIKHDFACTFTRQLTPLLVVLRLQSCLMLEGRARTLSGPSPELTSW
jgi:hypothetical protein